MTFAVEASPRAPTFANISKSTARATVGPTHATTLAAPSSANGRPRYRSTNAGILGSNHMCVIFAGRVSPSQPTAGVIYGRCTRTSEGFNVIAAASALKDKNIWIGICFSTNRRGESLGFHRLINKHLKLRSKWSTFRRGHYQMPPAVSLFIVGNLQSQSAVDCM